MHHTPCKPVPGLRCVSPGLAFLLLIILAPTTIASAHTIHPHAKTTTEPLVLPDLDNEASQWSIFQDGGVDAYSLAAVDDPSLDGQALSLSLLGGTPYTGIHAYRALPQISATTFELKLSFYLSKQENLQGLEFTMDQWHAGKRMEWAMQWEQFGDGTLQQGIPPTWRLWTGENWQNTGNTQSLALNAWHTFSLQGDTLNGQVHYLNFTCDDLASPLGLVFPPLPSSGEKIVIGTQLDGNAQEAPTTVTLDKVSLSVL
jgi:hypothetical protein